MDKIKSFWGKLPKTVKVFFYIALSTLLSELLIELRGIEQVFIVRFLAQIINMAIVLIEESVPAVRAKFKK